MKTISTFSIFVLLLFVAVNTSVASNLNKNKAVKPLPLKNVMLSVGDIAPNITLKGKGGKKKLYKLKGKIVLVEFWASWCLPCRKSNPQWLSLYKNYKKTKFTNAKGFEIFAVSLDEKKSDWKKAIKADKLTYTNNTNDKKGWDSNYAFIYGINRLPGYFLLNAKGEILAINPTPSQVQSMLQTMIK